jgi:hypothetical protein
VLLTIAAVQSLYGLVAAAFYYERDAAVAQGILIGVAIVFLTPGLLCALVLMSL